MQKKRFRRGDRVRFHFVNRFIQGRVKEDRGPIGVGGRRLYLVEFPTDPESPSQIELPAEQLESVPDHAIS